MSVNEKMTAIADAIRTKTNGTQKLTLDDMPTEIDRACWSYYSYGEETGYEYGYEEGKTEGVEEGYNTATEEINTELLEVIELQESYINPKISFTFLRQEHVLSEEEAYWTDKLSFGFDDWDHPDVILINIYNLNGYANWDMYSIEDSEGNLIKYNAPIKNNEKYFLGSKIEFTIKTNDGNTYLITSPRDFSYLIMASDLPYSDSRFVHDEDSGLYFTPEENGKKYFIPFEYDDMYIYLGDTINATLVEGGNE